MSNKKSYVSKKFGFSLIELSIVILVIGILVTGITQGSRILTQSKISTAKSLTTSSPIMSINGLAIWLEASDAGSFLSNEAADGNNLTTWYDRNPQSSTKNNVTRGTSNSNIAYESSGINGLPSVYFNGVADATSVFTGAFIPSLNNSFTAFVVYDNILSGSQTIIANGLGGGNGWGYQNYTSKRDFVLYGNFDYVGSAPTSDPEIATIMYNNTNMSLFINGVSDLSTTGTMNTSTAAGLFYVGSIGGGTNAYKGLIGEIIMFNRPLSTRDIKIVEQYLSAKWGIKTS